MITYKPPDSNLTGIDLKNYVQDDFVSKTEPNKIAEFYTGFGKTITGIKQIKKLASIKPNLKVHIVLPKQHLLNSWLQQLSAIYQDYPFLQIEYFIINSYTMNNKASHCDLLIIDEVHRALNDDSEYFSTAIEQSSFDYSLFLTATLKEEYEKFLIKELAKKNKDVVKYQVSLYWGFKNGLVPPTKIYNIPLELTLREKNAYIQAQDIHKKYSAYFAAVKVYSPYDYIGKQHESKRKWLAKELDQQEGAIFGMLLKWNKALTERKQIIQNAQSKYEATIKVLEVLNERVLVFCKTIDFADKLVKDNPRSIAYHSKLSIRKDKDGKTEKDKVLESFYNNQKPFLVSIDSLKEGFDIKSCQIALRVAFTSNDLDLVQQLGRVIRFDEENPNKAPIMANFVIASFTLGGQLIESQEEVWLQNSLKNQIYEVITLEQLIEQLK